MRDEPQRSEDALEALCGNCDRPAGPCFCGHCGQEVEARRGPFLAVLRELFADWLSLDSRLVRTLALLLRPGRLTERYLGGQRVAYLRPFRLYLVASVLLFSSLLSLRAPDASRVNLSIGGQQVTEAPESREQVNLTLFESGSTLGRWLARQEAEKVERLRRMPPQEVLDALFAGLRRVLPSAFILFVPFLALGLKVLYWRRKILFVDHLALALHFQSVLFFALATAWLMCRLFGVELFLSLVTYVLAGAFMLCVYMPMALARVYPARRRWTAVKAVLLIFIYGQLFKLVIGGATLLVTTRLS